MNNPLNLTYYGHCAFLWETAAGVRILIDPYRNERDSYWFLHHFPNVECDLSLITHAHFDHDAYDHLEETVSLLRMPGEYRYKDVSVKGVQDIHSGESGKRGMANVMFRIESAGIRFLHIGDNRSQIPVQVAQEIGAVDVLMITVDDSRHLLDYHEVDSIIDLFNPRIVIPMHYLIPNLTTEESTLLPPEGWLARQSEVRRLGAHTLQLSLRDLPGSREVWVMEPSPTSFETAAQEREGWNV